MKRWRADRARSSRLRSNGRHRSQSIRHCDGAPLSAQTLDHLKCSHVLFITTRLIRPPSLKEKAEAASAAKDRSSHGRHELRTPRTGGGGLIWASGTAQSRLESRLLTTKIFCRNVELEARMIDDSRLTRITRGKWKLYRRPADAPNDWYAIDIVARIERTSYLCLALVPLPISVDPPASTGLLIFFACAVSPERDVSLRSFNDGPKNLHRIRQWRRTEPIPRQIFLCFHTRREGSLGLAWYHKASPDARWHHRARSEASARSNLCRHSGS